jgi:pilus assembly protein Flp/PilA
MAAIAAVAQALRNAWVLTRLRGSVLAFRTHVQSRVGTTRWEVTVKNLITRMRTLMRDDSGQDLLEYALLVALIALVAVVAVTNSGKAVNSIFSSVATQLQTAANAAS